MMIWFIYEYVVDFWPKTEFAFMNRIDSTIPIVIKMLWLWFIRSFKKLCYVKYFMDYVFHLFSHMACVQNMLCCNRLKYFLLCLIVIYFTGIRNIL